MVVVNRISWISEESSEAIVTITDGNYELDCFSNPCTLDINQELKEDIYCFNNKGIMKSSRSECLVKKHQQSLAYDMVGYVEDINNYLIKIGELIIKIESGAIPSDIENGDYIALYTQRLDVY